MRRSMLIRMLALLAATFALVAGAVGAYAATRDSGTDAPQAARQEEDGDSTEDGEDGDAGPWLGLMVHPFKRGVGLVIAGVVPDGPADKAGLEQGDVIKAADGDSVEDEEDLREIVAGKSAGDKVKLAVAKNGVEDEDASADDVDVTVEARPSESELKDIFEEQAAEEFGRFLGGSFRRLDDEGNVIETEFVPGTVKSVNEDKLTIDVNGDEGDRSFDVTDDARVPDDLAEGDLVTVITENGELKAVHPGAIGFPGGKAFGPGHGHGFGEIKPAPGPMHEIFPGDGSFFPGPGRGPERGWPNGVPFREILPGIGDEESSEPDA